MYCEAMIISIATACLRKYMVQKQELECGFFNLLLLVNQIRYTAIFSLLLQWSNSLKQCLSYCCRRISFHLGQSLFRCRGWNHFYTTDLTFLCPAIFNTYPANVGKMAGSYQCYQMANGI
jgi:hypothetical protein